MTSALDLGAQAIKSARRLMAWAKTQPAPERNDTQEGLAFTMALLALHRPEAYLEVSREMCRLLVAAVPTMPEEVLHVDDLPWESCFCAFAEAPCKVPSDDKRADRAPLAAVQWGVCRPGRPPLVLVDSDTGQQTAGVFANWYKGIEGDLVSVTKTDWFEGEPPVGPNDPVEHAVMHRVLACLWRMVQQRIAVVREERPTRAEARRWARDFVEPPPSVIRVTLRRPSTVGASESECPTAVDWSHRWIVGGHWTNQWYPSLNDHRAIWIAPYVKGPADKPLVIKERVYQWTR